MLNAILARWQQKHRTIGYPAAAPPPLPAHFRGRPVVDAGKCAAQGAACQACMMACPTQAIQVGAEKGHGQTSADSSLPVPPRQVTVDLGRCLFCTDCVEACPAEAVSHAQDHRLAVRRREDLVAPAGEALKLAAALDGEARRLFGRSLKLRQVSAGGCNACEADTNVLNTVGWDLGRFGIQFVASPRHADGILITGPVSENMRLGLLKTWASVPKPKLVIVVGACAISGGPFAEHPETHGGATGVVPVDLFIPGCPPHPLTILDGLLRLLGRISDRTP